MGEGRGVYRVLVGRPKGKRPLGRPRGMCGDNIKMDLREIRIDEANRIRLAQDRVWCRACNESSSSIKKTCYYLKSLLTVNFSKNILNHAVSKYDYLSSDWCGLE
jgi:hypothetical protein